MVKIMELEDKEFKIAIVNMFYCRKENIKIMKIETENIKSTNTHTEILVRKNIHY
jgi:hypothetical protein